jgi:hypothetical protein
MKGCVRTHASFEEGHDHPLHTAERCCILLDCSIMLIAQIMSVRCAAITKGLLSGRT